MLPTLSTFTASLAALPPNPNQSAAVLSFANVIGNAMDMMQVIGGTVGVFTFNNATFASGLAGLTPVPNSSWITSMVNAWQVAVLASVIAPGTVSNPVWIGSGGFDVATLPSPAATIITLSAAVASLTANLANVLPNSSAPMPLAQAFLNAFLLFEFNCIGLGSPPAFIPIPIPLGVE